MTYKKLTLYKIDSEQPIASFDNPETIPILGSTVTLTTNGIVEVAGLEVKPPKSEWFLVLSINPSQDGNVEHCNVRVITFPD
jgi:hypothetical protein